MSEKDINRWMATIKPPANKPWVMGPGGSFDKQDVLPIPDSMLEELALWLRMGYTPWNSRSMPLSKNDREFMYLLYASVEGLIARVRMGEKALHELTGAAPHAGAADVQREAWYDEDDEPTEGGWYEVERADGSRCVRAFGAGSWWIPLIGGWMSGLPAGFKWRGPIADLTPEGCPFAEAQAVAERLGIATPPLEAAKPAEAK